MNAKDRLRAIELVRKVTDPTLSEQDTDKAMDELGRLVPDPRLSDLIFWPTDHPLSAKLDEHELTPERIVDLASHYKPFQL